MNKKALIIISWLFVLMWMLLIYYFSDMNGIESTTKSRNTINNVIEKTIEVTNEVGLTNKDISSPKIKQMSKNLDYPMRKLMHVFMYFILTLLLINALYQSGVKKNIYIFSILISFIYACTDEYHQSFRARTSSFKDVLIDILGGILAIILLKIIVKFKKKKTTN